MNQKNIKIKLQNRLFFSLRSRGFTLLEMIVSLGIFSVVAVIAVGSLVRITGLNRQAQSMQSAMNNINFALESISRDMRFGTNFYCGEAGDATALMNISLAGGTLPYKNCGTDPVFIAFHSSESAMRSSGGTSCQLIYAYWFQYVVDGVTYKSVKKVQQKECTDAIYVTNGLDVLDLTNVHVDSFKISVSQPTNNSRNFSYATINLKGYAGTKENEKSLFDVSTSVSQRARD